MKTVVQLLIVALVITACVQAGRSYYRFYEFKDRVEQEVISGRESTASELHQRIVDLGAENGIDLDWDSVTISRSGENTVVDFAYIDEIPFVPHVYSRDWTFEGSVSGKRIRPIRLDELAK